MANSNNMEDALVNAIEIQREGVEEMSSDSEDDTDIYGQKIKLYPNMGGQDEFNLHHFNKKHKCFCCNITYNINWRRVIVVLCICLMLICISSFLFIYELKQRYGCFCRTIWNKGEWFIITMIILFCADLTFLIIGIINKYNQEIMNMNCYQKYCIKHKKYNINKNDIDFEGKYERNLDQGSEPEGQ